MSSEDLKDCTEEVSTGDPECQMQRLKLLILAVTIRELETSGDKSCSLHQVEGTFVPEILCQFSENDGIQGELVLKEEKNTRTSTESMWTLYDPWQWSYHENKL